MQFALSHSEREIRLVLMGPGGIESSVRRSARAGAAQLVDEFLAAPTREAMVAWVHTMVADRSIVTDALIDQRLKNALEPGSSSRPGRSSPA